MQTDHKQPIAPISISSNTQTVVIKSVFTITIQGKEAIENLKRGIDTILPQLRDRSIYNGESEIIELLNAIKKEL